MKWLRFVTPFRLAALAVLAYYTFVMIRAGIGFSRVEGEGMSIVGFLFFPSILFFIDLVMHGFDVKRRTLIWTQGLGLLALVFWIW